MKKNILTFEEGLSLLHVGAYGFKFQSQRGDVFTVVLDHNDPPRPKIEPVEPEEEQGE